MTLNKRNEGAQHGLLLIRPVWSGHDGVHAATTTRAGGHSQAPFDDGFGHGGLNLGEQVGDEPAAVRANRARLACLLPGPVLWLNQVHGTQVISIPKNGPHAAEGADPPTADAAVTDKPDQVLGIMTADCLPVLLCDAEAGIVGAAHAGWRGLASGILPVTLQAMFELGAQAARIKAWIGPAIGPAVFEVGAEVPAAFEGAPGFAGVRTFGFFEPLPARDGKWMGNLPALAVAQLAAHGLTAISTAPYCTVQDARFYSYRRDGQTGRMASFIWCEPCQTSLNAGGYRE